MGFLKSGALKNCLESIRNIQKVKYSDMLTFVQLFNLKNINICIIVLMRL